MNKHIHLYPNPHGSDTDWSAVEGDNDCLTYWATSAAYSYDSLHFHASEAKARAAAEPENNLLSAVVAERDKAQSELASTDASRKIAVRDLLDARGYLSSAQDELRELKKDRARIMELADELQAFVDRLQSV